MHPLNLTSLIGGFRRSCAAIRLYKEPEVRAALGLVGSAPTVLA
jgi:hypothetical protein